MGDIREAFDRSVGGNQQVVPNVDDALVAAGRAIADQIDYAQANLTGSDLTKALYLTPHLMNVLREMYATPKSRVEGGIGKEAAGGKLAEIRDIRKRPAPTKKRAGA